MTHNYHRVSAQLSHGCQMIPVVKADAYGLGAVEFARVFSSLGASFFATSCIDEAMELRENGIAQPILLLGPVDAECIEQAIDNSFHLPLVDYNQARQYSDTAVALGKQVKGHIKLDSGLGRLGIVLDRRVDKAVEEIMSILSLPGLDVVAMFTHITNSVHPGGKELDLYELELFEKTRQQVLQKTGRAIKMHCLSSGPLFTYPQYQYDFVRVGALLTGSNPDENARLGLRAAVSLKTKVVQVKELAKGSTISYGPLFTTLRDTRIAIVSIGFSHGLRRSLANRGHMLINGCKAPILGQICCDNTILDITDIPSTVSVGDIVTLIGRDGDTEQTVRDLATLYPGSVAEVTTNFGKAMPRVYIASGL